MKKLLFISLAVVIALSIGLIGCEGEGEGEVKYDLTLSSSAGGDATTPGEGTYTYDEGTVVTLAATNFTADYAFVAWTGDVTDVVDVNSANTQITMNADAEVTATFEWVGAELWDYEIPLSVGLTSMPFHSLANKVLVPWCNAVNSTVGDDGGTFNLDISYGSALFNAEDSLYAIGIGTADIGQISPETFDLGGVGYIPFIYPDMAEAVYASWYLYEEDEGDWEGALKQLRPIDVLLAAPLMPAQLICTSNITAPDLEGLNTRADGQEVDTVEALNGVPKGGIGFLDVGNQMNLGTIDAAFLTYDAMFSSGAKDEADYVTETNLFIRPYILGMNHVVYDSLHPDARAELDSLSGLTASLAYTADHKAMEATKKSDLASYYASNPPGGIYELDTTELAAWATATAGVEADVIAYLDGKGYDGAGIVAEAKALVAAYTP